MSVPTCPDCRDGKCRICCGIALDDNDHVTDCACPACHDDGISWDCHQSFHVRCERHGGCTGCACHEPAYVDEDPKLDWWGL